MGSLMKMSRLGGMFLRHREGNYRMRNVSTMGNTIVNDEIEQARLTCTRARLIHFAHSHFLLECVQNHEFYVRSKDNRFCTLT
jgi:hypothetical protein